MNELFFGDNLAVLRQHVADESVDLIYLDPPFNSNRSYNVLVKSHAGDESQAQLEQAKAVALAAAAKAPGGLRSEVVARVEKFNKPVSFE